MRMADKATIGAFDTIAKLKHAAEALQESLPEAPSILLRLKADASAQASTPWPVQEIYTGGAKFSLSTWWKRVETTRCIDAAAEVCGNVLLRFSIGFDLDATASSDPNATAYHKVTSVISAQINAVMGNGDPATPNELVNQCAAAIMEPQVLAGILRISSVHVSLGRNGTSSKHTVSAKRSSQGGEAIIALGSNLGDRVANIEAACKLLNDDPDLQLRNTSPLYETRPMYYEDQETFVNGVCSVS